MKSTVAVATKRRKEWIPPGGDGTYSAGRTTWTIAPNFFCNFFLLTFRVYWEPGGIFDIVKL